ncbi:GxxExxY protein [Candidatus Shapirobacteria bacterium CG10_big_fil_rev_8_21_14_0_10_40_9]|uniref:GxxExxY protein n=1 Tax=Candidatus Shapirobacteria bacterium CG10_big_fil_rev_8_21_14_0_10_40_9 TaxID=1974888 RepID=A0A2M8L2V2_9BACT|nr:MAG: GxxExxY protein [Candidatus Shapirobacteria bacterium CG10_big_fil_rev_8_21_14_0_10_40_9]
MSADYLYEELTYKIIGAGYTVHKSLGSVHKESVYHKALAHELDLLKIPYKTEAALEVKYKGKKVGVYKPDFIVDGKVLVEIKAAEFIPETYESQLSYYLKGTGYKVGLLLNFGTKSLDVRRRIYDKISR